MVTNFFFHHQNLISHCQSHIPPLHKISSELSTSFWVMSWLQQEHNPIGSGNKCTADKMSRFNVHTLLQACSPKCNIECCVKWLLLVYLYIIHVSWSQFYSWALKLVLVLVLKHGVFLSLSPGLLSLGFGLGLQTLSIETKPAVHW